MKKIYYYDTVNGLLQMSREASFRTSELCPNNSLFEKRTIQTENSFTFYIEWTKGIMLKCVFHFDHECEFKSLIERAKNTLENEGVDTSKLRLSEEIISDEEAEQDLRDHWFFFRKDRKEEGEITIMRLEEEE